MMLTAVIFNHKGLQAFDIHIHQSQHDSENTLLTQIKQMIQCLSEIMVPVPSFTAANTCVIQTDASQGKIQIRCCFFSSVQRSFIRPAGKSVVYNA